MNTKSALPCSGGVELRAKLCRGNVILEEPIMKVNFLKVAKFLAEK